MVQVLEDLHEASQGEVRGFISVSECKFSEQSVYLFLSHPPLSDIIAGCMGEN